MRNKTLPGKPCDFFFQNTLRVIPCALLLLLAFVFITEINAQSSKPNIILILVDDLGYQSLSCNGGNVYATPNINKLAKQGMRFTQCHSSSGCSPSRLMLLTGKYNFRNYTKWGLMDPTEKTIGNMMKDAGYVTGFFGKDQLDGGGKNLNCWGFDTYCVHHPFDPHPGLKYKNPHLYTHGNFLPDNLTLNKYGPDIVSDSVFRFIHNNKANPFFIYYPLILLHNPFSPTPDDSEFAGWNPKNPSDTSYFFSMMRYMDKKIGQLMNQLEKTGIQNNTVIIFTGDNGTSSNVIDHTDGDSVIYGGKHSFAEIGTHVPLIVSWPAKVKPGSVNDDLIDFTDILPTLAGIANIPVPGNYGPLDGVSFSQRLVGDSGTPRNWIFNYIDRHPGKSEARRWAQTATYKLYDTFPGRPKRLFYNIHEDENEKNPLADALLSPKEKKIKQQLLDVLTGYVAEGLPLISLNPSLSKIADSSVVLKDTIRINGGSTIIASGAVWSTKPNPEISSSNHTITNINFGPFSTLIEGLTPNTTYYVRAYATNFAGTVYSNDVMFTTLPEMHIATSSTATGSTMFTANLNTDSLQLSNSPNTGFSFF